MDAGTLDLKTIFGQDRRHVVPLYQRPYVWEEKKQWGPLWTDIEAVARHVLADQPTRAHFLGAIVLEQQPQQTGCLETWLVIDGQQQLTTLQLLLAAFADFCKTSGAEQHHKALAKLTRNDDPMSDDPVEQFKVWPTTVDQEAFQSYDRKSCSVEGKEKGGVSCCDLFTNSSPRRAERIRHHARSGHAVRRAGRALSWPSRARSAASVPPAMAAGWHRQLRISSTASFPRSPCGSG